MKQWQRTEDGRMKNRKNVKGTIRSGTSPTTSRSRWTSQRSLFRRQAATESSQRTRSIISSAMAPGCFASCASVGAQCQRGPSTSLQDWPLARLSSEHAGKAVVSLPLGRAVYLLARMDSMAYWQKLPNIQKTMMHTDAMYVKLCIWTKAPWKPSSPT